MAPLAWVLIALGQDGSVRTVNRWMEVGTFNTANLIQGAVYLAVVGILLGLLGTLRVSPLGPLVAGLLLAAPYVGLFVDPFALRDMVPANWSLFGDPLPLLVPVDNGTTFVIGTLLLIAAFSRQRWRRWPGPAPAPAPAPTLIGEEPRTDWSALTLGVSDPDSNPPTLGYPPAPAPATPLPRRTAGTGSPWSAPPQTAGKPGGTTD